MRKLFTTLWFAASLCLLIDQAHAQTVCVILSSDTTTVVSNGQVPCGTSNPASATIAVSDSRWTAFLAAQTALAAQQAYGTAYAMQLANGLVLTSTGSGTLNGTYPLDAATLGNLQGIYSGIAGQIIAVGSATGTTLTVTSVPNQPQAIAVGQYVSGTGIPMRTKISALGTGTGGTGTYTLSTTISPSVTSEYLIIGGIGSGLPGGLSTIALADKTNTVHQFDPMHFMYYQTAVGAYLLACDYQAYQAAANTFPANTATIP